MKQQDVKQINTTALAFMGDAVYETEIRRHILKTGQWNADKLHRIAVTFVRAQSQATILKALINELTEEERDLVRKARNRKITSKPQNTDPVTYKLATAFEALVGYLYLSEDTQRLQWLISRAIQIAGDKGEEQ